MIFPLDLWDISLLLAVTAIVLLVTAEMLSPSYGKINININKKKLKNAAMAFSMVFLTTVAIRVINIILNP